jgi:hypothetical protein
MDLPESIWIDLLGVVPWLTGVAYLVGTSLPPLF